MIICIGFKRFGTFNNKQEFTSKEEILMVHAHKPRRLRQEKFQPSLGYMAESLYNKREGGEEGSREVEIRKMINGSQEKI